MHHVHIIAGGTSFPVRPHFNLSANAYGTVGHQLLEIFRNMDAFDGEVSLYTTRMAGDEHHYYHILDGKVQDLLEEDAPGKRLETNDDVAKLVDSIVMNAVAGTIIFMPVALCDFMVANLHSHGPNAENNLPIGKEFERLKSDGSYSLFLTQAPKIIRTIRKDRKDIFVVGFKTTAGEDPQTQFEAALGLLKKSSINLVLSNDIKTKLNFIVTPEQAAYEAGETDREEVLQRLVEMALSRSRGHFTRSIVAEGEPVPWNSPLVPASLRAVVDYCIKKGAYKPFLGATVGHFAFKVSDKKFITSRRKTNFNNLHEVGMVLVEDIGDDRVIAYGSRPSVGGQSQRIIFKDHPDMDCIVHFHCPLRKAAPNEIPIREQWPHECGSHECGSNTSRGLESFELGRFNHNVSKLVGRGPFVKAIMLDKHGPNIVYHRDIDPNVVCQFIDDNWDLSRSTSELDL